MAYDQLAADLATQVEALEIERDNAVADAERFRLALVAVCGAMDFELAYAAAIDALRQPERRGQ
jgi:hypothetical protein